MEIWQYILIIIGAIAVIVCIYYLIKKLIQEVTKVHHLPIRDMGFTEMPAVPFIISETLETIVKLGLRTQEGKMAKSGLSNTFKIQGKTQNAYTFLYDDAPVDTGKKDREDLLKRLEGVTEKDFLNTNTLQTHLEKASFSPHKHKRIKNGETFTDLFLDDPKDFSISWTNYFGIYKDSVKKHRKEYASILTDAAEATKQFWPMIAENGLAYNLLFLQKVKDESLEKVQKTFHKEWSTHLEPIYKEGLLYAIDLTIFNHWNATKVDGFDRWTPGAFIVLEQDKVRKKLHPICVQISNKDEAHIYTYKNTSDAVWIYALAAARTAVTVYGIWLGHVYHWHIVSAPMQMTLFNNVDESHDLRKLLDPQSKSLIGFNDTLLLLWKTIGPPTSFATAESFLELTNTFATGREFFDDDPRVAMDKLGINRDDFSNKSHWDQYPIVKHLLHFWDASEKMADVFVDTTYADDTAVFNDEQLQNWITASSDPEEGNVRGLPTMSSRKELKRVLTSLIYRVVAHGNSRQLRSLGPGLSFVSNYPPCLQKREIVVPDNKKFKIEDVLNYLPNTGTIGSMMTFYYIFIFSAPYEPLLPLLGNDTMLYFDDKDDPRNKALEDFRNKIGDFVMDYDEDNAPLIHQWPASIET